MNYVSTRGAAPPVSLEDALTAGLAPDGGLYVPERIPRWSAADLDSLPTMTLPQIGARVLAPFVEGEIDGTRLGPLVAGALDFPIPLVEIEPQVYVLELFHGPTLAFKDIAARVMARLFAAFDTGRMPLTVLVATSGDTGGAVAHAFAGVRGTRVIVLYPRGRVSPTQEAQLTTFNGEDSNVRAYAVDGAFDDCQRLVKGAFADPELRRGVRLTSANSINIGRLLPQMIYYFHAVGQLEARLKPQDARSAMATSAAVAPGFSPAVISTPSGNFGNLTAGVMAKRAGLPVERFIAATNVNDVVPAYLASGRFEPRASIATIANAMDVGNPSNFERLLWMYGDAVASRSPLDVMRAEIAGSVHSEEEVRQAIRRVYETRGYVLDPHSAIGYLALKRQAGSGSSVSAGGICLATAHPAKFREIVEPIVGRSIDVPAPLAAALAKPRVVLQIEPTVDALREKLGR